MLSGFELYPRWVPLITRARMAFGLMGYWLRSHFQKYVQWNGTFRLHRPDPIHRAFDSSCKKDTKHAQERQRRILSSFRNFRVNFTAVHIKVHELL